MIRVALVDDQPLLRLGYRMVLESEPDLVVVGEAGDGAAGVDLARRVTPDVMLMDVRMPILDGIEATRRIAGSGLPTRVLVLTTFDLDEYAFSALRAGASGFLLKDVPPADLLTGIRAVAAGDAIMSPSVTRRLIDAFAAHLPGHGADRAAPADGRLARLTDREREVLIEIARGGSNAEIAAHFTVSEATVKTHVGRILTKLGLRDRVQVVIYAYETGLIHPAAE